MTGIQATEDDIGLAPIVKTIDVGVPPSAVYAAFVSRFGDWWPRERFSRQRGAAPENVVLEPHLGGAIYEVAADGTRLDWGTVVLLEPERRIVMGWHLGRPVETQVEVGFEALGDTRTRVRLEHRGWVALEAAGASVERGGYDVGWVMILERAFASFIANESVR